MELIISYLDKESNVKPFFTQPELEITDIISSILNKIIEENLKPRCFNDIIEVHHGNFVNFIFNIQSDWNAENCETVMITGIMDEHENPNVFKKQFQSFIEKIKEIPSIFKAFYKNSTKTDSEIEIKEKEFQTITENFYTQLMKKMEESVQGIGSIIMLGISAVGKTSIINRLITGKFNENVRPTLSPQILKMLYERIDFRVYDVGGQVKLRKKWKTVLTQPDSIVFVIDSSADVELHMEAAKEFKDMMNHYFHGDTSVNLDENTPVLIMANKIDLKPDFSEESVKNMYKPHELLNKYHLGFCSALTGAGLEEGFQWLAKQIKISRKFK